MSQDSEYFEASRDLLQKAQAGQLLLCVAPQILAEFYAIVTDRRRTSAPQKPKTVIRVIEQLLAQPNMTLLPVPIDIVPRWTELIRKHPVVGNDIFDVQLVAIMLGNGVTRIYTYNRSDFEKYDELDVLIP